jgi:hypothetical protein
MKPRAGLRAVGISLGVAALLAVACEFAFRVRADEAQAKALASFRHHLLTGEMREFEARAYTNYQRPRAASNGFGFRDRPWPVERTPGVPRILCLGGSTTEGRKDDAYPLWLEQTLERRAGRDFEVLNAGMAGWTSAEMLVAWFLSLQDLDPDVVVLHEAVNDLEPRFYTGFRADYTHWRVPIRIETVRGP